MEFLDKVKSTFSSVVKVSGREGKKLYSITKLKVEITDKKSKKKALLKEIGLLAYKAHKGGESIDAAVAAKLAEVDALDVAIKELRDEIQLIKDTVEIDAEGFSEEDEEEIDAEIYEIDEYEEEPETEPIDPVE